MKFMPAIISLLVFIGLASGYVFLVSSIQADINTAASFLERVESLTKRDALARSMQVFLNDTSDKRQGLEPYIAGAGDVVSVIELVESTARSEGVDISISNVSTSQQDGWRQHESIEVTFSVSGTFGRIASFTAFLEALPIASRLSGVSLEASGEGEWFGTYAVLFAKEK